MKSTNVIVEVIGGAEDSKTFIVRSLPESHQMKPQIFGVFTSGWEVAQFFDDLKF